MNVQYDHVIEVRRPGILFINKEEKEVKVIDVAVSGDMREKDRVKKNGRISIVKGRDLETLGYEKSVLHS